MIFYLGRDYLYPHAYTLLIAWSKNPNAQIGERRHRHHVEFIFHIPQIRVHNLRSPRLEIR